jgi:hypothetical protein
VIVKFEMATFYVLSVKFISMIKIIMTIMMIRDIDRVEIRVEISIPRDLCHSDSVTNVIESGAAIVSRHSHAEHA